MSWKSVLLPIGLCVKNGMIWFIQNASNQLIGMDIHSFQIRKRLTIPCIPWGKSFFHRKLNDQIIDTGDKLLILLNGSNTVYGYDFSSEEIQYVTSLPDGKTLLDNAFLYHNGILFVLPYNSNCILKYDVFGDYWDEKRITNRNICIEKNFEVENDIILGVDSHSNIVYQYNFIKNSIEEIKIGDKDNHYWGITKAGGYCVMPHSDKRAVTLWKQESGETCEIMDFPDTFKNVKGYAYLSMYRVGNDVLLIPYYANMILKVDVKNKKMNNEFPRNFFWRDSCPNGIDDTKMAYYASVIWDKNLYLYSVTLQRWHLIDIATMNLNTSIECEFSEEDDESIGMLFDNVSKQHFIGYESAFSCCNLNNFILSVMKHAELCRKTEIYFGDEIWRIL